MREFRSFFAAFLALVAVESFVVQHRTRQTESLEAIRVRNWQESDPVLNVLEAYSKSSRFDPEGPLTTDCSSALQIQDSYGADGSCFLCAVDDDEILVGTAALLVGTQVTYLQSGSSVSTGQVVGAVRRVTAKQEGTLEILLRSIEERAKQTSVEQLIALAYPSTSSGRPSPALYESLGYQKLETKLDGVDAVQYGKNLILSRDTKLVSSSDEAGDGILGVGTTLVTAILLAAVVGVTNFMGFNIAGNVDNGGIGMPLTTQEVGRLLKDESLKRTTLDEQDSGVEDIREDMALLKIIAGQDVRIK